MRLHSDLDRAASSEGLIVAGGSASKMVHSLAVGRRPQLLATYLPA